MNFSEIIPSLSGNDIYIYMTQENPDWRQEDSRAEAAIHASGKKFSLPLGDLKESEYLASSLHHFINGESLVLSWGAKDFFSFLKGRTGILPEFHGNMYDIQIICSYFNYPKERPASFKEALGILRKAFSEPAWGTFKKFHDAVYRPLFSSVIPKMETLCLVDNRRRRCVYPTYVIEGQANGRLKAVKVGRNSYNPHSMDSGLKKSMRPAGYDESFVYFDFRNMEVCVLAWLSGDSRLNEILDSDMDPYREIWRRMSGSEPSDSQRLLCKNMFLPVVFGMGRSSLSVKMGISEKVAGMIIDSLVKSFPKAFEWVEEQSEIKENVAVDCFGRRREFKPGMAYKARNFAIQSPASMVCLRKLVHLDSEISELADLCFHVHDGYCLVCDKGLVDEVFDIGARCLESEDGLFPGLRLRTTCCFGFDLDNMQTKTRKVQFS